GAALVLLPAPLFFARVLDVQLFDLLAGPGGLAQELEARLHAGVDGEAVDADAGGEVFPAAALDELLEHRGEGDPVQQIFGAEIVSVAHRVVEFRMKAGSSGPEIFGP